MRLSKSGQMRLAEYLSSVRVESGETQADLAKRLKLKSPQYISNVERGVCAASIQSLIVFAALLPPQKHNKFIQMVLDIYSDDILEQLHL